MTTTPLNTSTYILGLNPFLTVIIINPHMILVHIIITTISITLCFIVFSGHPFEFLFNWVELRDVLMVEMVGCG